MSDKPITPSDASVLTVPVVASETGLHRSSSLSGIFTGIAFFWKYFIGMVLCQFAVGGILVVGWTYRLMRRATLKQWWKHSHRQDGGERFSEFLRDHETTRSHANWPNWFVRQNLPAETRRSIDETSLLRTAGNLPALLLGSLWINLKLGLQAVLNTWTLTMPACLLWWFAWYSGWNDSFEKMYEQSAVGPTVGVIGVGLFILTMMYVPMAQACQASTGSWQAFYQFGLVWRLIRRNWSGTALLAALYAALSLPVMILKTAPAFFPQMFPDAFVSMTDAEALQLLNTYFFWSAAFVLPCYVWLHTLAARVYATALVSALRAETVSKEELADFERELLDKMNLLAPPLPAKRNVLVRSAAWTASHVGRTAAIGIVSLLWFAFVAQIFVSEFFNYHPAIGWLNQPLVQLPWFHYLPSHLGG